MDDLCRCKMQFIQVRVLKRIGMKRKRSYFKNNWHGLHTKQ